MMKRYLKYICLLAVTLWGTSCSDVEFFDSEDEAVSMTYTIGLGDDVSGRAIGDGNQVDKLYVGIYEDDVEVKRLEASVSDRKAIMTIELFKGRTYDLAFWAQNSQTTVYDRTNLKYVGITYPASMTLQEADGMDAFFLLKEGVTVGQMGEDGGTLTLKRPFAQLNIASSETDAPDKVKKAVLTVNYENEAPLVLTFTDFTVDGEDKISYNEVDYYYLATAFLKPGIVTANVTLFDENDDEIKSLDLNEGYEMELLANYRYNVLGDMITPEELPEWDGIIPTESPLTQDEQNRYVIDEEADLAWLSQNASSLSENSTFIVTKDVLDMGNHTISSIQLPVGSIFDGGGKTIRNFANSLFGDVTNLTVQNLVVDNVQATSNGHVGVLVNTLTGSSTFTGVTVSNSSATTTGGAAGGMIGYIVRNTVDDRNETLAVTFSDCDLVDVTANGTESEGKFVGLLSGYDNGETLAFDADCSTENTNVTDYASSYLTKNQSVWAKKDAEGNDITIDPRYNGWLGTETYRRGNVTFEGKRLVPKWDGATTIEPIYEDTNKKIAQIWSPFDLAHLQGQSLTTLNFKENVDLGGGRCTDCVTADNDELCTKKECNHFTPIVSLNNLIGNYKTLYNLNVQGIHVLQGNDNYGMGFICQTKQGSFENFTFDGAIIRCIDIISLRGDTENGGNAYAGTLTSLVYEKMTINNVHAKNGHVIGISKFGGLIGYVSGGIEATKCSVDNYVIENHKINVTNSYSIVKYLGGEGPDDSSLRASCSENFYTEGEAGGFIGFISSNSTITDCHTSNITMKCYGQEDRETKILGEMKMSLLGKTYWADLVKIPYTIAGRHVNAFIGDIRTPYANIITINECTASGSYDSGYDYDITKTGKGELVGCCYFVGKDISLGDYTMHEGDYKGVVTIDGEEMPFVGG